MRYNVHPPRAFRNRIAKYLGVLVAAALVAALGLPSAAQAQTIARADIGVSDRDTDAGFKVTWTTRFQNDRQRRERCQQLDRDVHQAERLESRGEQAHDGW